MRGKEVWGTALVRRVLATGVGVGRQDAQDRGRDFQQRRVCCVTVSQADCVPGEGKPVFEGSEAERDWAFKARFKALEGRYGSGQESDGKRRELPSNG